MKEVTGQRKSGLSRLEVVELSAVRKHARLHGPGSGPGNSSQLRPMVQLDGGRFATSI
jgi:hypothetical protein